MVLEEALQRLSLDCGWMRSCNNWRQSGRQLKKRQRCTSKRTPAKPLHVFERHHSAAVVLAGKTKGIRHPLFVHGGDGSGSDSWGYLATSGEKSDSLALFSLATGELVSRGVVGFEATALASECEFGGGAGGAGAGAAVRRVAAARGGDITLLEPVWRAQKGGR